MEVSQEAVSVMVHQAATISTKMSLRGFRAVPILMTELTSKRKKAFGRTILVPEVDIKAFDNEVWAAEGILSFVEEETQNLINQAPAEEKERIQKCELIYAAITAAEEAHAPPDVEEFVYSACEECGCRTNEDECPIITFTEGKMTPCGGEIELTPEDDCWEPLGDDNYCQYGYCNTCYRYWKGNYIGTTTPCSTSTCEGVPIASGWYRRLACNTCYFEIDGGKEGADCNFCTYSDGWQRSCEKGSIVKVKNLDEIIQIGSYTNHGVFTLCNNCGTTWASSQEPAGDNVCCGGEPTVSVTCVAKKRRRLTAFTKLVKELGLDEN